MSELVELAKQFRAKVNGIESKAKKAEKDAADAMTEAKKKKK